MFNAVRKMNTALRRVLAVMLALILALGMTVCEPARADGSGTVRVKLTRLGSNSKISFTAGCAYVLSGNGKMNIPAGASVTAEASGSSLYVSCGGVKMHCGSGAQLLRQRVLGDPQRFSVF